LGLKHPSYLPFRTFTNFEVDPLASITGTIANLSEGHQAWIQTVVRPINNSWQKRGKSYVDTRKQQVDSEGKKVALESGESEEFRQIETKNKKVGFQYITRIVTQGPDELTVKHMQEDIIASFKQYQTALLNSIEVKTPDTGIVTKLRQLLLGKRREETLSVIDKYKLRFLDERIVDVINIEELASLFHLPSESVETPNIARAMSKRLEIPKNIPTKNCRIMGETDYRNTKISFGIKDDDRRRHTYILGKTGSGKSVFIKNMIIPDILEGKGVGVIDPHGDLVEEILNHIPPERMKDVVYIDPSDMDYPIGLNMIDVKDGETIDLLADGIVSVFKKFFENSWGPRLQYILTNTILTLLNCQNVSLLAVQRILTDKGYRKFLLKQVKDPFLVQFWEQEFENMSKNPRLLTEAIAPIQNKVGRFLNSPMVRNMIGQVTSKVDFQKIMNEGKILLVNLSQGKIGEENSSLLGGMIVTRLYSNAMQRAFLNVKDRKDFYLYVDEFQNFATETFVKILSEARKYGLNLIVTHQYIDQVSEDIQKAIFGNVGTIINFVVGQHDAKRLAQEFTPDLEPEDLVNLERYKVTMKMMIDGSQSKPFTASSVLKVFKEYNLRKNIREISRQKYALTKESVENKLVKWAGQNYDKDGKLKKS